VNKWVKAQGTRGKMIKPGFFDAVFCCVAGSIGENERLKNGR
jgi:hypothetical protein